MPTDNEWEQRVLDRQTGYTPPIPAVDQPEPRREHCRDCAGSHVSSTGDYSECPGLAAPSPEAAGLREAVEKFLRRWDDPERYHPIPAVDDLRAALAAPEAAGLRELADEITKDWNGRPDVCPNCGHSSIGCVAPSQADRGLDAATTEYLAWAEADVPPDRTFEDWHDKGTVLLRNLAARLQDSIPDSSSQETE